MPKNCHGPHCTAPRWMRITLVLAALYNIGFGVWTIVWPESWFTLSGLAPPLYPQIWQALGMVVGVYGVGYAIAAIHPIRYWPIVLVGFLGKIFGPLGFAYALYEQTLPWKSSWLILTNDLVWLIPFAIILWAAIRRSVSTPFLSQKTYTLSEATEQYMLNSGESLAKASKNQTLAIVFLRHFGCTFTRKILLDLQKLEQEAKRENARLVLVHMLNSPEAQKYLGSDEQVSYIADPSCELYRSFGLGKGTFWELFGPRVWINGVFAIFQGCGVGHLAGDGLQMPGAFLFRNGKILSSQKAKSASDLPNLPGLFAANTKVS